MTRIRTIKPEMAKHEGLYDLELETGLPIRFAWAMLPTACDREGRFKWLPRTLKADILPHDPIDFSRVLDAWLTRGFIVRYRVKNEWFGWVCTFRKHQVVNTRESASSLPSVDDADEVIDHRNQEDTNASSTRESREHYEAMPEHVHAQGEGKGREGNKEGKGRSSLRSDMPPSIETKAATSKPRKPPSTPMPADWDVPPDWISAAEQKRPGVDWRTEAARFVSHHRAKGSTFADWKAAWWTWVNSPYAKTTTNGSSGLFAAQPERPRTARRLGSDQ